MSDGSFEVQEALYAALIAQNIAEVSLRIYDGFAPVAVDYPYIVIGSSQSLQNDAQCLQGLEEFIDLDIWSRYEGMKELKSIISQIRDGLHQQTLSANGRSTVHIWVEDSRLLNDPDGETRHGIVTLKIIHFA